MLRFVTGMVDWEMNFSKIYLGSLMKSQLTGVKPVQVITYSVSEFFSVILIFWIYRNVLVLQLFLTFVISKNTNSTAYYPTLLLC